MNQQQTPMYEEFQKILNYTQMIVRFFSVTVEVFLRHSFGERYLNVFTAYGAIILLAIGYEFPLFYPKRFLFAVFALAFVFMCFVHRITISKRRRKGVRWHSRYAGTSYDFWKIIPLEQHITQLYFEPTLIILAGFLIIGFTGDRLGGWLVFSGLCLAVTGQIDAARFRNQVLDVMDSQIESEQLNRAVVELKDPSQTEGFSVPVSLNNYSSAQRVSFADAIRRVDPALRGMMSDTPQEVKTPNAAKLIREMEEEKAKRDVAEAKIKEHEQRLRQWR
jgi:hypothetical protein